MGSIVAENRKSLMLFSGRGFPQLAAEIGAVLGIEPTPMDAYEFANGEIFVRYHDSVRGREPITARLIADLLKTAGADRILTVDLHTAQIQGFFDGPVDHLFAMNVLAEYVESKYAGRPMTVVAPDSGRVRVAERWSDRLGCCPLAFIHKTRDPLKPNEVVANRLVGDVEGRVALIVDDMIDTGSTIAP